MNDVLVIGAGLAGLTAAWQAASQGKRVRLVAKGWGATHWHSGCIDVLGHYPLDNPEPVASPAEALTRLIAAEPDHPYSLVGVDGLARALEALQALCAEAGYPLHGSLEKNWLLPSAVGTFRPTCLAPETMVAGDLSRATPMLLVGFKQLGDFYPHLAADNLSRRGIPAEHALLDLPELRERNFITTPILAGLMEQPDFRTQVAGALKPLLGKVDRVGFPAVLGRMNAVSVKEDLEAKLGRPVFEIPGLPPSVAGMRLHHVLTKAIEARGGRVYSGMKVISVARSDGRVTAVYTESAARRQPHPFHRCILATGGILGGGIFADNQGRVREVVFDLPVSAPGSRMEWFRQAFMAKEGHPIYRSGLTVNRKFQPVTEEKRPLYDNLFAAGTTLAHCEVIRERSFEGVAVATGYLAGQAACEEIAE